MIVQSFCVPSHTPSRAGVSSTKRPAGWTRAGGGREYEEGSDARKSEQMALMLSLLILPQRRARAGRGARVSAGCFRAGDPNGAGAYVSPGEEVVGRHRVAVLSDWLVAPAFRGDRSVALAYHTNDEPFASPACCRRTFGFQGSNTFS